MSDKPRFNFPKRFLWGATTAAHQVEGGNYNQWSQWELANAKVKAAQAEFQLDDLPSWPRIKRSAKSPANYISGDLVDHYHNYKTDFDLLEKMHMNAYRFSVEWSRIEPNEGAWNREAIDHYKKYVAELKRRGIEPVVTLFHFTLPTWFTRRGGFTRRRNIKFFVRFARKIMPELGGVRFIITINEPEVYANNSYQYGDWPPAESNPRLSRRVIKNLARAHNQTARVLRKQNRRYKISIAKASAFFYPGDDAWLSRWTANRLQRQEDYALKKVVRQCDFLGVNYYFSNRVYGSRIHNPNEKVSDMGWDMQPADIQFVLERLHYKYKLPIIITENGLADADDTCRQWWLSQTLTAMQAAINHGVQLKGYLHWSLMDNFEWAYGRWPRFGLAEVNYQTGDRTLRPSARWLGRVIKQVRGL